MGPQNNPELFSSFAHASLEHTEWEVEARRRAEATINQLSDEFKDRPTKCPVVDPTLVHKLYALSRLSMEEISVLGFNAVELVDFSSNGGSVEALAGPTFDEFETANHMLISTRALLFMPGESFDSTDVGIQIFGLNVSAENTQTGDAPETEAEPSTPGLFVPTTNLVTTRGEPIHGRTNVFAIHNKQLGALQIYGVTVGQSEAVMGVAPYGPDSTVTRNPSNTEIIFNIANNLSVKVTRLENGMFDQAVDEFQKAVAAAQFSKNFASDEATMSPEERAALRDLSRSRYDESF